VTVSPPDLTGRRQILDVHVRGVPLASDVDLDEVAASTPGMVGADLKNLVNEAALLAARRDHDRVTAADFSDALEKTVLGTVRGIMLSPEDKERTAFHESGHAQGLDHPAEPGPRGDVPEPADRPVRVLGEVPAGQDRWGPRRPGRCCHLPDRKPPSARTASPPRPNNWSTKRSGE
jgi:hypothetical protein